MVGNSVSADRSESNRQSNAVSVTLAQLVALRGSINLVRRPSGQRVSAPTSGGSASRALGRGLDFAEVREYHAGDDVRLIDWNVTARSGRPHTKIFNEERERPFFLVIDLRASMFFATRVMYKSVWAARLAATLAWAASARRDRVGGVVLSDSAVVEIKPTAGSKGVTRLLHAIVNAHDQTTEAAERYALATALERLERNAHTGSAICLISDFKGFDAHGKSSWQRLLRRNHLAAVQIFDPLEARLPPPAEYAISDGDQRQTFDASTPQVRQAYEQAFAERCEVLNSVFGTHANTFHSIEVTQPPAAAARQVLRLSLIHI